jgi:hypothetical protein
VYDVTDGSGLWFTLVFLILSLEGDGFLICADIYVVTTVIAYDTYGAGFC